MGLVALQTISESATRFLPTHMVVTVSMVMVVFVVVTVSMVMVVFVVVTVSMVMVVFVVVTVHGHGCGRGRDCVHGYAADRFHERVAGVRWFLPRQDLKFYDRFVLARLGRYAVSAENRFCLLKHFKLFKCSKSDGWQA